MAKKYYGVRNGRKPGVYYSWDDCRAMTDGFPNAAFKSFKNEQDAYKFVYGPECKNTKSDDEDRALQQSLNKNEAVAYVDGSYKSDTGVPTYGVVFITKDDIIQESGKVTKQSWYPLHNVAGEMAASMKAMNMAIKKGIKKLTIYHDYIGIQNWCIGSWKAEKKSTIQYKEYYKKCCTVMDIKFIHVKGHTGNYYNEMADKLAGNVPK